jgi:PhnB protein
MPKKIDPLNSKQYAALTTLVTVADVKAAAGFYQKAFGFVRRSAMAGPDGKLVHAELTLRGVTLMLGAEHPEQGARSAKTWAARRRLCI